MRNRATSVHAHSDSPPPDSVRQGLSISGAVQGVGFRPFVYRLASELHLAGWVSNTSQGVAIEIEGSPQSVHQFETSLRLTAPPQAVIQSIRSERISAIGDNEFVIRDSADRGEKSAVVLPDFATCGECVTEVFDRSNRRYRYPFTNCTNCGPRYSIIEGLPYDRASTTMRDFTMCPECRAEYDDPHDRRFHAQPNACPNCGPRLALWSADGQEQATHERALQHAANAIRRGRIVAVKGLGGFHLVCDARAEFVVHTLRMRKRRFGKPFAVMYPDVETIGRDCALTEQGATLLTSSAAPIVLLERRQGGEGRLSESVAPGYPTLGVMLAYTPLHHLLMGDLGFPIVATSGNVSDEPICTDEHEALARLQGIADLFLVHDRPIARPVDDSVMVLINNAKTLIRCARGYAPQFIASEVSDHGCMVAVGSHFKNSIAIQSKHHLVLSQHIGDLESLEASHAHAAALKDLEQLLAINPAMIVTDLHPDYHSTRMAETLGCPTTPVQHHHAHVVSCMVDNALGGAVLGISWDGTGLGTDNTIWGGEFLDSTRETFVRFAHLRTFPLPGGDAAIREPRRSALGLLYEMHGDSLFESDDALVGAFRDDELIAFRSILPKRQHAPLTSSAGRLFDAVAALLGVRQHVHCEGQAAIELECLARLGDTTQQYPFALTDAVEPGSPLVIDWQPMIEELIVDAMSGRGIPDISLQFHRTLATIIREVCDKSHHNRIALTGGCFQNVLLTELTVRQLRSHGYDVYTHHRIPPNDGGLAIGQLAIARAQQ